MIKLNTELEKNLKKYKETSGKFNEFLRNGFLALSEFGWYISANVKLTDSIELIIHSKKMEKEQIDEYLKKYYTNNIENLADKLKLKYPDRSKIIEEGLKTQRLKMNTVRLLELQLTLSLLKELI